MLAAERLERIATMLRERRTVSVSELSELFDISDATTRRDLTKLEQQGLLKRTYGGAVSLYASNIEAPFAVRAHYHVPEKKAIARAAAAMVSDGETVVLDAGTTTAHLARALKGHRNLTVITNSERVMNELYDSVGVTVIATGGELKALSGLPEQGDLCMVGPIAEETLRRFRPSKAFLGASGITIKEGISNSNLPQAKIKQLMVEIADQVIMVTDCSKFGHLSYSIVAPVNVLDHIITDCCIKTEDQSALEALGIHVITVEPLKEPVPKV